MDVQMFSVATEVVRVERVVEDARGGGGSFGVCIFPPAFVFYGWMDGWMDGWMI